MTLTHEQLEKSREEFEAEFKKLFLCSDLERTIEGDYVWLDVDAAWKVWQASRQSLVVELPVRNNKTYSLDLRAGFNACLDKVKKSLQSAGINYREKE